MAEELLQEEMSDHVNRVIQEDKLKGLYAHLKDHPALMERRLYVGSQKPQLPARVTVSLLRIFSDGRLGCTPIKYMYKNSLVFIKMIIWLLASSGLALVYVLWAETYSDQ